MALNDILFLNNNKKTLKIWCGFFGAIQLLCRIHGEPNKSHIQNKNTRPLI